MLLAGLFLFFMHFSPGAGAIEFEVPPPPAAEALSLGAPGIFGSAAEEANYLCPRTQNEIEGYYRNFFAKEGFTYNTDAELRKKNSRRLKFDRQDLSVEVLLTGKGSKGVNVKILKYRPGEAPLDIKDFISYEGPAVILPEKEGADKFEAEPLLQGRDFKEGKEALEIPPPPESEPAEGVPAGLFTAGGEAVAYRSGLKPSEVARFYEPFFKRKGFKHRKDKEGKVLGFQNFRFESSYAAVDLLLKNKGRGSELVVVKYPSPDGTLKALDDPLSQAVLPEQDMPGMDIEVIPRPPGGVRTLSYRKKGLEEKAAYTTPLGMGEVLDFYRRKMPSLGWRLLRERSTRNTLNAYKSYGGKKANFPDKILNGKIDIGSAISDSYVMDFDSYFGRVRIIAYPNIISRESGSMVNITYVPSAQAQEAQAR